MKGGIAVALCFLSTGPATRGCPVTEDYALVRRMLEREGQRLLSPTRIEAEWRRVFDDHAIIGGVTLSSTQFADWEFYYDGGSYRLVYVFDQKRGEYAYEGDAMITLTFRIQTEFVPEKVRRGAKTEIVKREVLTAVALADIEFKTGIRWSE